MMLMVFGFGCGDRFESLTTHTSSTEFSTKEEKMDFLFRYLVNRVGLLDAEYRIDYQDNSGGRSGVPGPSEHTMYMALRIVPDSLDAWLSDVRRVDYVISREPWKQLDLDATWNASSTAEFYMSNGQVKLLHRQEGVLFACYSTTPLEMSPFKIAPDNE